MAERTYKPGITESVKAQADLLKQRFVGFDGNYCGAGAKALGICDVEITQGQFAPVVLNGILLVETGGAVTSGAKVASDADGKAVAVTASEEINGFAIDSAAGAVIRIARGI